MPHDHSYPDPPNLFGGTVFGFKITGHQFGRDDGSQTVFFEDDLGTHWSLTKPSGRDDWRILEFNDERGEWHKAGPGTDYPDKEPMAHIAQAQEKPPDPIPITEDDARDTLDEPGDIGRVLGGQPTSIADPKPPDPYVIVHPNNMPSPKLSDVEPKVFVPPGSDTVLDPIPSSGPSPFGEAQNPQPAPPPSGGAGGSEFDPIPPGDIPPVSPEITTEMTSKVTPSDDPLIGQVQRGGPTSIANPDEPDEKSWPLRRVDPDLTEQPIPKLARARTLEEQEADAEEEARRDHALDPYRGDPQPAPPPPPPPSGGAGGPEAQNPQPAPPPSGGAGGSEAEQTQAEQRAEERGIEVPPAPPPEQAQDPYPPGDGDEGGIPGMGVPYQDYIPFFPMVQDSTTGEWRNAEPGEIPEPPVEQSPTAEPPAVAEQPAPGAHYDPANGMPQPDANADGIPNEYGDEPDSDGNGVPYMLSNLFDPSAPGPTLDPALLDPVAPGPTLDPNLLDLMSPGPTIDPALLDPNSPGLTIDPNALDPNAPGETIDPNLLDPGAPGPTLDPAQLEQQGIAQPGEDVAKADDFFTHPSLTDAPDLTDPGSAAGQEDVHKHDDSLDSVV